MSLTAQQQELRRYRIGASEIGAVLGIDKRRTRLQLWMDKKGLSRQSNADDHRSWGLDVESAILRNYARRNGYQLLDSPGSLAHPTLPLVATPDGLAAKHGRVRDIQAKNVQEYNVHEWGEPGTTNAPLFYVAQVVIELGVLHAQSDLSIEDEGDIAASFGGRPPLGYRVPFNAELFGNLAEAAAKFVRDHLETDKPPTLEGDRAALEYVKRRFATSTGELREPTPEAANLVARLRALKADASAREETIEAVQAELCALIGDAQGFDGLCTWSVVKEQRKTITNWPLVIEQLATDHRIPREAVKLAIGIHTREEVVKDSYRRLTLAKERNGKS